MTYEHLTTKDVSILMPVLNETWSFLQVLDIVMQENESQIKEVIIPIHGTKTTKDSLDCIKQAKSKYPGRIIDIVQDKPWIGGAVQKGFETAKGNYLLMMASDLETDPHLVKSMIATAKKGTLKIVTASRWIPGGGFEGYNPLKKILNYIFQKFFSTLYNTNLTDMTYGFRILPIKYIKGILWEELKHPIFFESILKPLKLGATIVEIPAKWEPRQEGVSQIQLKDFLLYFVFGFKLLLMNKNRYKKPE